MNTVVSSDDLVRRYIDAYNRFDIDAMCALLTPDIQFEHYANGELGAQASGLQAFRALAETGAALFAQREQRLTALRIDGNRAFAAIAFQGKLATDVPRGPPAGTVFALDGRSEFTFEQGCISKIVDRSQ